MEKANIKETKDSVISEMISSFNSDYNEMNKIANLLNESNASIESHTTSIEEFRQAGLDAIRKMYNVQ